MTLKVIILLLFATLLAQCLQQIEAKPLDDNDDNDAKVAKEINEISMLFTTDGEKPTPLTQLKITILHECSPLLNFSVHEGKKIFQNVLKDGEILTNPSDDLETQLAEFTQFVDVVEKADSVPERIKFFDLLEIANRFKTLVAKYNTTALEHPSPVEALIAVSLKKNGLPEFLLEFNKKFENTIPQFKSKIDAYLDLLTPEQRKSETKLDAWYTAFTAEENIERKRMIFSELFKL